MSKNSGQTITIKGNKLECVICKHDQFLENKFMLNTSGATFFGFDWANENAINYICGNCGHILWFSSQASGHDKKKGPFTKEQKKMFPNTKCPVCGKSNKDCNC